MMRGSAYLKFSASMLLTQDGLVHFLLQHMHRHTCPTFLQCTPLTLHLMKSPPHMLHTPHQQRLLLTFLQHLHQCLHLTQHRLDHLHPHTTLLVLGLPAPCRILARLPTNLQLPQLIPLSSLHWPRHILHGWLLPIPLLLLQSLFTRHLGLLTLHPSHQCLLPQSLQRLTHPSLPLMHQGLPLSLMSPSLPHQPRLRCHLVMTFRYPANLLHLLLYPRTLGQNLPQNHGSCQH